MFVSCPVAKGKYNGYPGDEVFRGVFPELEGKAKELYVKAFGQEHYDIYLRTVNSSPKWRVLEEGITFKHKSWHDCESFLWVLAYELGTAWPEGKDQMLTPKATHFISAVETHEFADTDRRNGIFSYTVDEWKEILHPELASLAVVLNKLFRYFCREFAAWPEFPEDHGHEVLKRLLLSAIVELMDTNHPIPLNEILRVPEKYPDLIRET